MLSDREHEIKNLLIEEMGGPRSYVEQRKLRDEIDPQYVKMELMRIKVHQRRAAIFCVLYLLIAGTSVYVVSVQTGSYSALLWVGVATFNAFSGAAQYAQYVKRKLAHRMFTILQEDDA